MLKHWWKKGGVTGIRSVTVLVCFFLGMLQLSAQEGYGYIQGRVVDAGNSELLPFVNIILLENNQGAYTDSLGNYLLGPVRPGRYTLKATAIGYTDYEEKQVQITAKDTLVLKLQLQATANELESVVVQAAPFTRSMETPISLRNLGTTEIERNPGSDNDISKVIQTLPGVTTTASFRNDLIIRGGAPNENRFFLDDIEIPVINHLVTQGASGGAFSILNANLLREVDYLSASFPANRGNALSSVFNFSLKDGRTDRLGVTATLGGTEMGLALEGPIGNKTSILFSARRSYRQYILRLLNFAFLPVYNDLLIKAKINFDAKNELTLLGVGALDDFQLNFDVGNNEIQRYLLENLPLSDQSNYTTGAVYKHYANTGYWTFVASRSGFRNGAEKYWRNESDREDNLLLRYTSRECSSRARLEYTEQRDHFRINLGAGIEDLYGRYDVFSRIFNQNEPAEVDYLSEIRFQQYSAFGQISTQWWEDRIGLTLGLRMDGNNYNQQMNNPLDQLSGRLALSVALAPQTTFTAGIANYYQLPPMMTLSYQNSGQLDNRERAEYLKSWHYVAGFQWDTPFNSRLSLEGFLKHYPNYMFSLRDSVSLAHLNVDFGVFGNFPVDFGSRGRSYGLELFYQQRLFQGFYGMLAYTLGWSEYQDKQEVFVPATWDARHILNLTLGRRFNQKWEAGINWRFQSALPYSPFREALSSRRVVWDVSNQGIRDYDRLNTLRGKSVHTIDLRVDRIYQFKNWTLNVFFDLENITADSDSQQALVLDRPLDAEGNLSEEGVIINPEAPYNQQRYRLKSIANAQGALIPTFGFIAKW